MHGARAGVVVLGLEEIGQDVVPRPTGIAELAPVIIVRRLAAHVDHAVDRRASAEHLAARVDEASPVETRLGRGLHHPVRARVADAVQVSDRNADPVVRVAAPGFEQEHAGAGVFGQAVRQYAAGGAGAHDDVVVPAVEGLKTRHALDPPLPAVRGTTFIRCPASDSAIARCGIGDGRRSQSARDGRIGSRGYGWSPDLRLQCSRIAATGSKARATRIVAVGGSKSRTWRRTVHSPPHRLGIVVPDMDMVPTLAAKVGHCGLAAA